MTTIAKPTPISGITYVYLQPGTVLTARDGMARLQLDAVPIPLEEADIAKIEGGVPDYDMVGRGLFAALRNNPDCAFNGVYAGWLRDAYPHHLAELASLIIMLDHKDVEVSYLDRKINYLKVMALLEPDNPHFLAEIGATLLDRGLRFSGLNDTTVVLYRAEPFLKKAHDMNPADTTVRARLAELSFLLGRYELASSLWEGLAAEIDTDGAELLRERCRRLAAGNSPRVPPVDYLQAIGCAFNCFQEGQFEECAAILADILDDLAFCDDFALPEVWYHLGLCHENLALLTSAADCFAKVLRHDPGHTDAQLALARVRR